MPTPRYNSDNTSSAYQLHYHFGWYSRCRKPRFESPEIRTAIEKHLREVAERHDYHVLEAEVCPTVVRALLSLKPSQSPSKVTNIVRGNLARRLGEEFGERDVWSRTTFVRGVGKVTADVIRRYIARQFPHHRAVPLNAPKIAELARYHDPRDATRLRKSVHAVSEYNVHFALATERRFDFLDYEVAEALIEYWRRVCNQHEWIPWDIEIVPDHAHLFLGLRPKDSPEKVALNLMNNSEYFCESRYSAALCCANMAALWQPGFFAGTGGLVTTAQVRSYLTGLSSVF